MNRDEAIIGNLLDRIRARFKADPNWGVYDGMLCRSDLEVLLDIISALESDKINNTMNLEHLTADLAAMTTERDKLREQIDREEHEFEALITQREKERDAAQRRAEAAEADLNHIAQEMFSDNSDDLRGAWYPCEVCKKYDGGKDCYDCLAASYDESNPGVAFEWRGPDAQHDPDGGMGK